MRTIVFVSHANPEDNEFTRWLCLQLAREGFQVWSDITRLIGGEVFWAEAEDAIRQHTAKFLFVLSKTSNQKQGPRDELDVAKSVAKTEGLRDFIIPLKCDDLDYDLINVAIHRLNVIDFSKGWAGGLSRLFEKLAKDGVPNDREHFNPHTVASWWRENREGPSLVLAEPEEYLSNWFKLGCLPMQLFLIPASRDDKRIESSSFPSHRISDYYISFASPEEHGLTETRFKAVRTEDILQRDIDEISLRSRDVRYAVTRILRIAWDRRLSDLGMPSYQLANKVKCFYFTTDMLCGRKRLSFEIPELLAGQRSLVGSFRKHTWHFALSGDCQLTPFPKLMIRYHVLFSDDGRNIWPSESRLHSARRSACKDWWNPVWRDRTFLALDWLAHQATDGVLSLALSPQIALEIPTSPICFASPVSYKDELATVSSVDIDDDLDIERTEEGESE